MGVISHQVNVNGAVVYFEISADSDRAVLSQHWTAAGFGDFVPAPRRDASALRAALQYLYGQCEDATYLVRTLGDGALAVQREVKTDSKTLEYTQILTADADGGALKLEGEHAADATWAATIRQTFIVERDRLTGTQIARAFVDALVGKLGATTLRAAGGVYWTPEGAIAKVEALALGIECASLAATGRSQVYCLSTAQDEAAARAIAAALTAEVESEVKRIEDSVASGLLGKRALATREAEAKALGAKVIAYEATLGRAMDTLREAAGRAEAEACRAALQAMAEDAAAA